MRPVLVLLAAVLATPAADWIEAFGHRWRVPVAQDWAVVSEDGVETLRLLVARPQLQPRRPIQYALAETPDFSRVTLEAEVRNEPASERGRRTSLILVYAWRDEAHFNYAHLSVDSAQQVPVHNGIFHVYGGERVRISPTEGPPALTSEDWHRVRLEHDGATGRVRVSVNGKALPALEAVDLSLRRGKVGLGSFFDLGSFRRVRIEGVPAR
jgi:hypothetical protein